MKYLTASDMNYFPSENVNYRPLADVKYPAEAGCENLLFPNEAEQRWRKRG
jgi:hypothetical protein